MSRSFSLAVALSMCRDGSAAHKTKGFAAAKALTDPKVKNANARSSGISAAVDCDKVAAKPLLATLSKDPEKWVAEKAAKEAKALEGKK